MASLFKKRSEMNGRTIVDTNVLVELLMGNRRIAMYLHEYEICISAITEIELLSNPSLNKSELLIVQKLIQQCTVFDELNESIKTMAAKYRRNKIVKKTPDAIIAATAFYYKLSLFTMDADFEHLKEIDIVFIK